MKKIVLRAEAIIVFVVLLFGGLVFYAQWYQEGQLLNEFIATINYRMFQSSSTEKGQEENLSDFSLYPYTNWWIGDPFTLGDANFRGWAIRIYDSNDQLCVENLMPSGIEKDSASYYKALNAAYDEYKEEASKEGQIITYTSPHWHSMVEPVSINGKHYVSVFVVAENVYYAAFLKTIPFLVVAFILLELLTIVGLLLYKNYLKRKRMLDEQREVFLHAISHELKTPSAIIKNAAELLREEVSSENKDEYLQLIDDEVSHLDNLLSAMLIYSDTTQNAGGLAKKSETYSPLKIAKLVEKALETQRLLIAKKGITVKTNMDENWTVQGDKKLFPYVVENLISNAVKYCEPKWNGTIEITAKNGTLTIFNTCGGIPAEDLPHIWEPLYTVNKNRSENSTGMGLAIVSNILNMHQATYSARNVAGGVEFEVTFRQV